MRFFDYCAFTVTVLAVILTSLAVYGGPEGNSMVVIEAGGSTYVYSLAGSRLLEFEGPLGVTVVRIAQNSARVEESPCPDKLCIRMGVLTRNSEWSACLPNRVFLRIEAQQYTDDEIDALSF